jgi:hypothetical protein
MSGKTFVLPRLSITEHISLQTLSTIPWAMKTGNLTLRPFSVVTSIIYDNKRRKQLALKWFGTESGKELNTTQN